MTDTLHLGDLAFEVRRSARCKRLESTVQRDGSLVVSALVECLVKHIETYTRAKRRWVYRKLAAKEGLTPPVVALANAQPNASLQASAQLRQGAVEAVRSGKAINRNNDKTNDISGAFTVLNHRHYPPLSLFYRFNDLPLYRFAACRASPTSRILLCTGFATVYNGLRHWHGSPVEPIPSPTSRPRLGLDLGGHPPTHRAGALARQGVSVAEALEWR